MPDGMTKMVVVAEDSQFDQMILKRAFAAAGIKADLRFVDDGEDLLSYLTHAAEGSSPHAGDALRSAVLPSLVLMDLHMPRMDGREALRRIRQSEHLRHLPIVMLTTSESQLHIREFHALGANSYLVKPNSFNALMDLVRRLSDYWFETASLPGAG